MPTPAPRQYGANTLDILVDGLFDVPRTALRHGAGEAALADLLARITDEDLRIPVHAFLLRGPDGTSLIDAGCGTEWGPNFGHLRTELAARHLDPADIDRLILTHLHGDHALGALAGQGAYFPHAELWVPETDWTYFTNPETRAATPTNRRSAFDIATRLATAYAGRIRPQHPGQILPNLTQIPLPGHTPGQSGYRLKGPEGTLLIVADTFHLTPHQMHDPAIRTEWDTDPNQAEQTRRDVLRSAKRNYWTIAGGHFASRSL